MSNRKGYELTRVAKDEPPDNSKRKIVSVISSTSGITSFGPYTVTDGRKTYLAFNGFEPCDGSPGPLGSNVSAVDGTVNGTTCVVQPIGPGAVVEIVWDSINKKWWFFAPNSAQ